MGAGDLDVAVRELAPRVLGAVVRRYGHFSTAEDAVQEALVAAARRWPTDGVPDDPTAWLIRVASRRLTDLLRAEQARQRREHLVTSWDLPNDRTNEPFDATPEATDDALVLLVLCCHPALSTTSQMALTLRAVGGLTTAEVARALLSTEATITRRITRAKRTIESSGEGFRLPSADQRDGRLATVLHVLYLMFTEGYSATAGTELRRPELTSEAIRLAEMACHLLPGEPEAAGLLALMLLTDARSAARTSPDGDLIPLREQNRSLWDADSIKRGTALVTAAMARGPVGPYQLQAAIAALHCRATSHDHTDWTQIAALYAVLSGVAPSPVTRLNQAVAIAMAGRPDDGLRLIDGLDDPRLERDHRLHAARAQLLEMRGDSDGAAHSYALAARHATNLRHVRYLNRQLTRINDQRQAAHRADDEEQR